MCNLIEKSVLCRILPISTKPQFHPIQTQKLWANPSPERGFQHKLWETICEQPIGKSLEKDGMKCCAGYGILML